MPDWTIECGGATKTFAEWGIAADMRLTRENQGVDVCELNQPGPVDVVWSFGYGAEVIIRKPDDSVWFRGWCIGADLMADGGHGLRYQIAGLWWQLQRIVFQQVWPVCVDDGGNLVTRTTSEVFLCQAQDGTRLTSGQTITEALNWANTCWAESHGGVALLTIGSIDSAANVPIYNQRDTTVAEVIVQMLRWTGETTWVDYSTAPPTLHARKLANLTSKSVSVDQEVIARLAMRPRYDQVLPAVIIRYKTTNDVNGSTYVRFVNDYWPTNATGKEVGASVHTIELAGFRITETVCPLRCTPILAAAGASDAAPVRLGWWATKIPWLRSSSIVNTDALGGVIDWGTLKISPPSKIVDENDQPVALSQFPNELADGQIADWMGKEAKTIKIYAEASYTQFKDPNGKKIKAHSTVNAPIHVTVRATNATTGTYRTSEEQAGEEVPTGLAQAIYDARQALQYEGGVTLVGSGIPAGLGMGCKLNIVGLNFALNNQLIQQTVEEPFLERLTCSIGPSPLLGVSDLIELLTVNRNRILWTAPAIRKTGGASWEGRVKLGDKTPQENATSNDSGSAEYFAVASPASESSNTNVVEADAANAQWVLCRKVNATGADDATAGKVILALGDTFGKEFKLREFPICIDGIQYYTRLLGCEPYLKP